MNSDGMYMKTIHVPVIIETDEDGIFIVSCPQFKRLSHIR
jgi:predicted RNase H-like HicB family nuclease